MATYIQIGSTVTVGSGGASSIDFTSIPSTFTDILVKLSARTNDSSATLLVTFNGSSSNLSSRVVYGTGGATGSYSSSSTLEIPALNFSTTTANTFNNLEMYIPNYAGSTYKSTSIDGVQETNAATTAFASLQAGLWSNTAAITQVTLTPAAGSFVQYTTASLYGIKKD